MRNLDTARLADQSDARHATLAKKEAIQGVAALGRSRRHLSVGRLAAKVEREQLVAVRVLPALAAPALHARGEGEHHGVAGLHVGDAGADGADVAGPFVAEDEGRREQEGAGGGADVGVADGGGYDVDEDVVGAQGGICYGF